jgi:hypothetical protein
VKKIAGFVLAIFVFFYSVQPAWAWGREGHRIVAIVALNHVSDATKAKLTEILGTETLVSISTWPDEIRHDRDETSGWHYVDIPKNAAFFDEQRDCYQPYANHKGADTDHHDCIVDRIEMFSRQLADTSQSNPVRLEALKFVVHFVGDVHQPLHAIDEAAGGNQIKVVLFGSATCGENHPCNLHGAWDGALIEHTKLDENAYASKLEDLIRAENLQLDVDGTPADWANESHRYAEGALVETGGAVDQIYFDHEISVVDQRLALAGLRLARLLDDAMGNKAQ